MVEFLMPRNYRLPAGEMLIPSDGKFFAITRLYLRSEAEGLYYGIVKELTPKEFYDRLGRPVPVVVDGYDLSEHLVKLFDYHPYDDGRGYNTQFVWVSTSGDIQVHQHST